MFKTIYKAVLTAVIVFAVGSVEASEFDQGMEEILGEYLKIQGALAADEIDGIEEAVAAIEGSVKKLDPEQAGDHAQHYKAIPQQIAAACPQLASARDIKAAREAFNALSKPVAMWVGMAKPQGVAVMYCPMVESVWVQRSSEVANPYFGAEMLGCGQKVGGAD